MNCPHCGKELDTHIDWLCINGKQQEIVEITTIPGWMKYYDKSSYIRVGSAGVPLLIVKDRDETRREE